MPPGIIAVMKSVQRMQRVAKKLLPAWYPFPTGRSSLDQRVPGLLYHNPFPEWGNPIGARVRPSR